MKEEEEAVEVDITTLDESTAQTYGLLEIPNELVYLPAIPDPDQQMATAKVFECGCELQHINSILLRMMILLLLLRSRLEYLRMGLRFLNTFFRRCSFPDSNLFRSRSSRLKGLQNRIPIDMVI